MKKDIVPIWVWLIVWFVFNIGIFIGSKNWTEIYTGIAISTFVIMLASLLNRKYD